VEAEDFADLLARTAVLFVRLSFGVPARFLEEAALTLRGDAPRCFGEVFRTVWVALSLDLVIRRGLLDLVPDEDARRLVDLVPRLEPEADCAARAAVRAMITPALIPGPCFL
jgi:hypothetical protein